MRIVWLIPAVARATSGINNDVVLVHYNSPMDYPGASFIWLLKTTECLLSLTMTSLGQTMQATRPLTRAFRTRKSSVLPKAWRISSGPRDKMPQKETRSSVLRSQDEQH